ALLRAYVAVRPVGQDVVPLGGCEVTASDLAREAFPRPDVGRPVRHVRGTVDHQVAVGREPRYGDPRRFRGERVPKPLARSQIPEAGSLVERAGGEEAPVGGERDWVDSRGRHLYWRSELRAGGSVQQNDLPALGSRSQQPAVG